MASQFDVIFAFKQKFEDATAADIISTLRCHPAIWDHLSEESNYLRIANNIGDEPSNWNIARIIDLIENNVSSIDQHVLSQNLQAIITLIQTVQSQIESGDWNKVIEQHIKIGGTDPEQSNHWGTVFSYFYLKGQNIQKIENALVDSGPKGAYIIAFLIKNKIIASDQAFLGNNFKELFSRPKNLLGIAEKLAMIDSQERSEKLVRSFFAIIERNENNHSALEFSSEIQRLVELSGLAKFIKDEQKEQEYLSQASRLMHATSKSYVKEDAIDFKLLERGNDLRETDKDAARALFIEWIRTNQQIDKLQSIAYLPIDKIKEIVSNSLQVDLHIPIILFVEQILSFTGRKPELEILIGDICADYGDQARAIKYLHPLFGEDALSRDQKTKLANAFAYDEDWGSAGKVFSSVNKLTTADALFSVLCKQHTNPEYDIGQSIKNLAVTNPKSKALRILENAIIDERVEAPAFSKLPEEESRIVLHILYDYISRAGKASLLTFLAEVKEISPLSKYLYAKHFSESLPSEEINTLYSNLYDAKIPDQKLFEMAIDDLLDKELFFQHEKLLVNHSWKWPLSKKSFLSMLARQLNDQKYNLIKSNLEWAIEYFPTDNKITALFGAHLLHTTLPEIPFSREPHRISVGEKQQFQKLINRIPAQDLSIDNQILKIEILSDTKTNDYLALGTKHFENAPMSRWKVLSALGNHFFHQNQFDQTIIYLEESRKLPWKSDLSLQMLIASYIQLKMYDEAANLIRIERTAGKSLQKKSLRKFSESLYENELFYQFLIERNVEEPENISKALTLVRVLILRGAELEALKLLDQLEGEIDQGNLARIDLADLYLEAGAGKSSKRILDTYLSNKQSLDDLDLILSAKLFFNLDLFEKSLNILAMIDDEKISVDVARSSIHAKIGEIDLASQALMRAAQNPEKKKITTIVDKDNLPNSWVTLDSDLLETMIIDLIKKADFIQLRNFLDFIHSESEGYTRVIPFICYASQITGDFKLLDEYFSEELNDQEIELLPIKMARISAGLIQNHEIEAALLISEIDHSKKHLTPLLDLLESRLQIRQNQNSETGKKIETIFDQFNEKWSKFNPGDEKKMDVLILQLNLAEALCEIQQIEKSYSLIKNVIKGVGFTPRIVECYRKVIYNILFDKKINEILLVTNHGIRLDQGDEAIFEKYLELNEEDEYRLLSLEGLPDALSLSQIGKSEHLIDSGLLQICNRDDLMRLISSIESEPNEAIPGLTQLLKNDGKNPWYLFALGLAYRQAGDYSKSYTLINLALEIWPNEYRWHEIAAELCEKIGDNLNAARHRSLIQEYSGLSGDNYADNYLYLQKLISDCINGERDIPKRDLPALLDYAEELSKWNSENIANRIVSRILEVNPKNLRAQLLLIETIMKQRIFSNANQLISNLLKDHPDEIKALELQVRILIETGELQAANVLIEKIINAKGFLDGKLPFLKAEIIEKETGADAALDFIKEQLDQSTDQKFIQLALAYLIQKMDFLTSQKYNDQLLEINSNDSESLFLAGKLAEAAGDLDKALDYYNRAITINPFVGKIYIACAELYETRRQSDLSQKSLEEGIQHNPNDFILLKYAGNYFAKIGKEQYAIDCLRRAYTINRYDKNLENALGFKEG